MTFFNDSILFSKTLHSIIKDDPFQICDIGARGELTEPWNSLYKLNPNIIKIFGFEPDKDEFDRLYKNPKKNFEYFPCALWNEEKEISITILQNAGSSSIHPPNFDLLKEYDEAFSDHRKIEKIVKVQSKLLDQVLDKNCDIDFLKIDAQGSEYEIIEGSKKILQNSCFGCTLETWTIEIHKGQYLSHDIMKFMYEQGFLFFDFQIGSSLGRRLKNKKPLKMNRQIVGLDFLYIKNSEIFFNTNPNLQKVAKAAAIADVWGFPEYAIQLIEKYESIHSSSILSSLKSEIIKRRSKSLIKNMHINKVLDQFKTRILKMQPSFPNIH